MSYFSPKQFNRGCRIGFVSPQFSFREMQEEGQPQQDPVRSENTTRSETKWEAREHLRHSSCMQIDREETSRPIAWSSAAPICLAFEFANATSRHRLSPAWRCGQRRPGCVRIAQRLPAQRAHFCGGVRGLRRGTRPLGQDPVEQCRQLGVREWGLRDARHTRQVGAPLWRGQQSREAAQARRRAGYTASVEAVTTGAVKNVVFARRSLGKRPVRSRSARAS